MPDKSYTTPPEEERISAKNLRKRVSDGKTEAAKEKAEAIREGEEKKRKAYREFMARIFTEQDRLQLRQTALKIAEKGLTEIEVMRFPSEYLEDKGRRINNNENDWQDTLTGYAKSFLEAYNELGEPLGYKLVAKVLNYPGGMIGEIGLYLVWE